MGVLSILGAFVLAFGYVVVLARAWTTSGRATKAEDVGGLVAVWSLFLVGALLIAIDILI